MAALAVAIWTKAVTASHAADVPTPSAAKLERISEFFNNEVATGKAGRGRIDPAARQAGLSEMFGVRDVATKIPMTSNVDASHPLSRNWFTTCLPRPIDPMALRLTGITSGSPNAR